METKINEGFAEALQAMWHAENQLVEAMPAMISKASALGLQKNLALHLQETDQQKVAIQAICKQLNIAHTGKEDKTLQSLLAEGQKAMEGAPAGDVLDAVIAEGAIKIEQYEIAQYDSLAKQAAALGYEGIAKRLWLSFEEERQAETKLKFLEEHLILMKKEEKTDTTGRTEKDQ